MIWNAEKGGKLSSSNKPTVFSYKMTVCSRLKRLCLREPVQKQCVVPNVNPFAEFHMVQPHLFSSCKTYLFNNPILKTHSHAQTHTYTTLSILRKRNSDLYHIEMFMDITYKLNMFSNFFKSCPLKSLKSYIKTLI